MRIELGLGDTEAGIRVREALRIRGLRTTTLWVEEARVPDEDVLAAVYTVLCDGVGLPAEDDTDELQAWGSTVARYPACSLYFADLPDRFPGVAFVAVAANIWHPDNPGAVVRLRWSPSNPTDYAMSVASYARFHALNAGERNQLIAAASTLFDRWARHRGGRPLGGTTWTREEFLGEMPRARQKLRAKHGRKPSDGEIAAEMGISEPTYGRYKRRWVRRDAK
jgi:hypothetical protein